MKAPLLEREEERPPAYRWHDYGGAEIPLFKYLLFAGAIR